MARKKKSKRRTGRIPKLDRRVAKKIVDALKSGSTMKVAAGAAKVGRSTLLAWLAKGRKQKRGVYKDFLDAVRASEPEAELSSIKAIRKAEKTDWRSAAWMLERRHA